MHSAKESGEAFRRRQTANGPDLLILVEWTLHCGGYMVRVQDQQISQVEGYSKYRILAETLAAASETLARDYEFT